MYVKLALRNAKRSARDYLIYFITIAMTMSLIFAYNLMLYSDEIRGLSSSMDSMTQIIGMVTMMVAFITGWLIHYTTRFILQRRSREFGTYLLLGMEKTTISRMFLIENLIIGLLALLCGMAMGTLLYQVFASIIMNVFGSPYRISLFLSPEAVLLTLIYFLAIYLFVLWRSRRTFRKSRIYDFMVADKQNQHLKRLHPVLSTLFLFLSVSSMALGIWILSFLPDPLQYSRYILGIISPLVLLSAGVIFLVIGIYGFSITFSSFLLLLQRHWNGIRYKGLNLFLLRQTTSKVKTNGFIMGTISLLLTVMLLSVCSGFLFNSTYESTVQSESPFDVLLYYDSQEDVDFSPAVDVVEQNTQVEASSFYHVYQSGQSDVTDLLLNQTNYIQQFPYFPPYDLCMPVSTYNRLCSMLGYSSIRLEDNQYAVHIETQPYEQVLEKALPSNSIRIGDQDLTFSDVFCFPFAQWAPNGFGFVIIVPDHLCKNLDIASSVMAFCTAEPAPLELRNELYDVREALTNQDGDPIRQGYFTPIVQSYSMDHNRSVYTILSFAVFYLGIVLIFICATILAIQQLSDAAKYRYRYDILHKMGVGEKRIGHLIFQQLAIYFGIPLILPVCLCIPLTGIINEAFSTMLGASQSAYWYLLAAFGLFLVIYLCYFVATLVSFKRGILSDKR
ncbi:Bacitracin export permease protein BceB [Eubacteriaceae bacterium CHKCI005]|nr:Bacitracin export permease protein BceB [Eubacteriaceae bacterium CHKCI005]